MALFKTEAPGERVTLADLYPDEALAGEVESNLVFDIYHAGQRTFRKHWFRIGRLGHLPAALSGQGDAEQAGRDFIDMLVTHDGFEAGFELVSKGVIFDAQYPAFNGRPDTALSELSADERDAALRELFDEVPELLVNLLMAALNGAVKSQAKAKERAKKSSASSRRGKGSKARKSAE